MFSYVFTSGQEWRKYCSVVRRRVHGGWWDLISHDATVMIALNRHGCLTMDSFVLDTQEWAEAHFGDCDFGDARLTKRLVNYAGATAVRPNETTPQQARSWKDTKGAYRFMDNSKVTFEKIIEPHCRRTREFAKTGVWLSICDTTELSFALKRKIKGLGPVGNGIGRGFFLHSSFFVSADSDEIVGLAGQELYYRTPKPPGDTSGNRKKRRRESEVWGRVADQVGSPAPGVRIIHVCDRGADDYEFYCHCLANGSGWVVRVQHLSRKIYPVDPSNAENHRANESQKLSDYVATLELTGTYELNLRATKTSPPRTAKIEVRHGSIWVPRTTPCSPWVKQHGPRFIRMDVVDVREIGAPKNVEPLRWILLTESRVTTFEDAWTVIGHYEKRPLVEEYHKAAKTGCAMEERLYRKASRLERVVGILSILAARLVQLKSVARIEPDRPATKVAPKAWVKALCANQLQVFPKQTEKWNPDTLSTNDFFRGVAMMGGFLARKSDGEPGWITIWRGVKELLLKVEARKEMQNTYG
jgi:hypothetical protein